MPTDNERFSHVHLELMGPLTPTDGYHFLLTCVDRFICWLMAVPIADKSSEIVASFSKSLDFYF